MFKVMSKHDSKIIHTVYSVRRNEHGDVYFLVYIQDSWGWLWADDFEPVE
jgi:hypothetical protein